MNSNILIEHGINYSKGVNRFMGDAELYETVLSDIVNDTAMPLAIKAYESGDMKELEERAHELKGVAGNMEMTELYHSATQLVALLRGENYTEDDVKAIYDKFRADYDNVIEGVKKA